MSSRLPESPSGATTPGSPGEVLTCVNPDEWEGQPITATNVGFTAVGTYWGEPAPTTVAAALDFVAEAASGISGNGTILSGTSINFQFSYTATKSGQCIVMASVGGSCVAAALNIQASLTTEGSAMAFGRTSCPAGGSFGIALSAYTSAPVGSSNIFALNITSPVSMQVLEDELIITVVEI